MERQRDKAKEDSKEIQKITDNELEVLRKELERLRELKKQKELKIQEEAKESTAQPENEEIISEVKEGIALDDIENRLNDIDKFLLKQFEQLDEKTYEQSAEYIESELQVLEEEILGEKGLLEKELSPYEKLLNEYSWIDETKYQFMYTIPNKKKNPSDFESWKTEWSKVLFDYAKYAILHIIYLRQFNLI